MSSTILRRAVMAAALSLVVCSIATADQRRPGAARAEPDSQSAVMPHSIRAKQVIGAKVSIQNDVAIGTVDDIVLSDAGDVEYLIVITSDKKLVTVPWSTTRWGKDFKSATVNISPDQFKVVPQYSTTAYPDYFAPTYRNEIYKYYGARPGVLRRLGQRVLP